MVMTRDGRQGRVRRQGLRAEAAADRERAIDELVEQAEREGGCTDRMFWTLHHDFRLAPMTSNLQQLREVGLEVPAESGLADRELQAALWEVIETLADLGVFLLHTDHLDDRALYGLLERQVLREPVRDLPPSAGVAEFIDLGVRAEPGAPSVADRDRFLPRPETPADAPP
jgi:hypothetical protein